MSEAEKAAQETTEAAKTEELDIQSIKQVETKPEETTEDKAKTQTEEKPKEEKKVEEEKPKEEKPAEKVVPEKYDLKLPEKSLLDAARVEKIAAYAKERGLSNEEAQAILERESEAAQTYHDNLLAEHNAQKTKWAEDAKADSEIGGESFVKNAELAHRVIKRFGTPEFVKEIETTGYGNHPELLRIFLRIGKVMSEDMLVLPGVKSESAPKTAAEILYGGSAA